MRRTLRAALGVCRRRAGRLVLIALAAVVPIVAAVTALDLIAWREAEPGDPDAAARGLGDGERIVDAGRMRTITVVQYALGALAYLVVIAATLRALEGRGGLSRALRALRRREALGALAAALATVAAVRVAMSLTAAALLAPLGAEDATAYLVAINAVHGLGKLVTAPYLAALAAVLAAPPGGGPGPHSA